MRKHDLGERLVLKEEHVHKTQKAWGVCLIGYILGKYSGAKAIKEVCDSWKVSYLYFLQPSGCLVFKFEKEKHREKVLVMDHTLPIRVLGC